MEVVILSAGSGTRIGQDGKRHMPLKHLLRLSGETVIERQVRLLRELEIHNIKIVAGQNRQAFQKILGNNIEFMETRTGHKNALYELADVCRVTKETEALLVLLGDIVFSKEALKEMLTSDEAGITVFGSGELHELGLKKEQTWWNRGDEIFAVKLSHFYIQTGHTLFGSMPDKYYELKNIHKQLSLKVHPIKECCDIDQPHDYAHTLKMLHSAKKR